MKFIKLIIASIAFLGNVFAQNNQGKINIKNIGPQVFDRSINGSKFVTDTSGNRWLYTTLRGEPARLLGYRVGNLNPELDVPLPEAYGSWSITQASDGWVYIGSDANALLYRTKPGVNKIEELGLVLPNENYLWELTAGKDGEIFGGTYPGGKVFRYHPNDGFSQVGTGSVKEGENYVRSIVYYKKTDKLYVGIGAHTSLHELNPRTGYKKEILPIEDQGHSGFVHGLGLLENTTQGDILLVNISGTKNNNKTWFYNLEKEQFEDKIGSVIAKSACLSNDKNIFYFTNYDAIYSYTFKANNSKIKKISSSKTGLTSTNICSDTTVVFTNDGKLWYFNPKTDEYETKQLNIPPSAIQINTLTYGPDGKIWTSGYPVGTNASYDPLTGESKQYLGLSQAESITPLGKSLYFGVYSGAKIYKYDTEKQWDATNNPKLLGVINGQDRPFASTTLEKYNKIFFGTVPNYGVLGGALVEYNVGIDSLIYHPNIFNDLSLVSMSNLNNKLIIGTSIWGGLGVKPKARSAKLLIYDPERKMITNEIIPVEGADAITTVMIGPDNNIWGIAEDNLFIIHHSTLKTIYNNKIFSGIIRDENTHLWKNAKMVTHPNGKVYVVAQEKLWEIEPKTKKTILINDFAGNGLILNPNSNTLFFQKGVNLYEFNPNN